MNHPPAWSFSLETLGAAHRPRRILDWGDIERDVQTILSGHSTKKWSHPKRLAWERSWHEFSEQLFASPRTYDDFLRWKALTIEWHRPVYEAGTHEWHFSLTQGAPESPESVARKQDIFKDASSNLGTVEFLRHISHFGLSWADKALFDTKTLRAERHKRRVSSLATAVFEQEPPSSLSDEQVFSKAMHANWNPPGTEYSRPAAVPWPAFAHKQLLNEGGNKSKVNPYDIDPQAKTGARFWFDTITRLPVLPQQRKRGDYNRSPDSWWSRKFTGAFLSTGLPEAVNFQNEWAAQHQNMVWPVGFLTEFWDAHVSRDGALLRDAELDRLRGFLLQHAENAFREVPHHLYNRGAFGDTPSRWSSFKKWVHDKPFHWAAWRVSSTTPFTAFDFNAIWHLTSQTAKVDIDNFEQSSLRYQFLYKTPSVEDQVRIVTELTEVAVGHGFLKHLPVNYDSHGPQLTPLDDCVGSLVFSRTLDRFCDLLLKNISDAAGWIPFLRTHSKSDILLQKIDDTVEPAYLRFLVPSTSEARPSKSRAL
jgi:hypothetical protein